jgi:4-diphosphocytidyl-2-C-methyl-D-erythritol kinase
MVAFPHCKINLGLHVIGKRTDGYHDIVTCFYPVPLCDILEVISAADFQFSSSGETVPGRPEDNLCVKAWNLLKKDHDIPPVHIHMHKIVPMGAGLGGGSSNGAFTLRMINEVLGLQLSKDALQNYARQLGSDCTFFLEEKAKIGRQKGDLLDEISISLKGKYLILVKPPVHISTAEAYSGITPSRPSIDIATVLTECNIEDWKGSLTNHFERTLFQKYPSIQKIKEDLYKHGALYASMSGSGSAVYGIFEAAKDLRMHFQGMYYWAGALQ